MTESENWTVAGLSFSLNTSPELIALLLKKAGGVAT